MANNRGRPKTGSTLSVPVKQPIIQQIKNLPVERSDMPTDDDSLKEILIELSEKILTNLNEVVTIVRGKSHSSEVHIRRRDVFQWASNMAPDKLIADMYNVDRGTIQKYFRKELDLARALGRYRLQDKIFNLALAGTNTSVLLFAAKNYLNMTDVGLTEALDAGVSAEAEVLVQMTPAQVTALLRNATLTNTISIEPKDDNE